MTLELQNRWFLRITLGGSDGRKRELGLSTDMLQDIQITSSIDQILPTFKMVYDQKIPAFQDDEPLVSPVPAKVSIGQTSTNKSETEDYHLVAQRPNEGQKGNSRRPMLIVKGLNSSIIGLMENPARSFSSLEEAVRSVSESVGAPIPSENFSNIAPSINNDSFVQPRFSNATMLRYLQNKAIGTGNWGYYRYWIDRDGTGHFRTIGDLLGQPVTEQYVHASTDNPGDRVIVSDFDWILDSRESIRAGGFGRQSHRWDWENGSYQQAESGPSEAWRGDQHTKIADEPLIKERERLEEKKPGNSSGKQSSVPNARTEATAKSDPIEEMLNTQGIKLTIRGRVEAQPGDVVELVITDPSMTGQKQQVPSGQWLMHTKTEGIQREIVTRAILVRDSHNQRRS